jgi:septal ring factor EnvC (AmiA/AmiB activator)
MARQSRKEYLSKLAEYRRQLRAVKKAIAEVRSRKKALDLKLEVLEKRVNALIHQPFIGVFKA